MSGRGIDAESARLLTEAARAWARGALDDAAALAAGLPASAAPLARLWASRALAALGAPEAAEEASARALALGADAGDAQVHARRWHLLLEAALGATHAACAVARAEGEREAPSPGLLAEGAEYLAFAGDVPAAARLAARALAAGVRDARLDVLVADGLAADGRMAASAATLERAVPHADGEGRRTLVEALLSRGALEPARRVLEARPDDAALAALGAELASWHDTPDLDARLARLLPPERARVLSSRALAAGRLVEAEAHLAGAREDDPSVLVLRGELALRRGNRGAARDLLVRAGNLGRDSAGWVAQQALLELSSEQPVAEIELSGREALERALRAAAPEVLAAVAEGAPVPRDVLSVALEVLVSRLGPNRTRWTVLSDGDGGLVPLPPEASPRTRALRAQDRLKSAAAADVLASLAALERELPHAPHVALYRGEVLSWEGRDAEAEPLFRAGAERRLRWAPIGMAAVAVRRGDLDEARRWLERSEAHPAGPGPTYWVVRGEWALAAGDAAGAREHLERALALAPTRVSALALLALASDRVGEAARAGRVVSTLRVLAPLLLGAAARTASPPGAPAPLRAPALATPAERAALLPHALALFRGNRSSSLPRHFDGRGRPVVPAPEPHRRALALDAGRFGAMVRRLSG